MTSHTMSRSANPTRLCGGGSALAGLALVGLGLVIGIVAFFGVGRVIAAILYGVGTRDPITLAIGIMLLAGAALLASWLPARRASRVDPMEALRHE